MLDKCRIVVNLPVLLIVPRIFSYSPHVHHIISEAVSHWRDCCYSKYHHIIQQLDL